MSITTFTELKTAIGNYLDRADLTSYTSDFVTLAQKRIKRDLRVRQMEYRATATMGTTTRYMALPSNYIQIIQFQIATDPVTTLKFVTEDQLNKHLSSTTGTPKLYTIANNEFQFEKVCDSAYGAEITYYKFTEMSGNTATNETFPEFQELYLQGALAQAYMFTLEHDKASYHEQLYQMYLRDIVEADAMSRITDGPLTRSLDWAE